jgi:small subunit ribosomal protein S5
LVVVGDREGHVGHGFGKARQVPGCIEKANKDGRKHLVEVPMTAWGSIPHEVQGEFCGARIILVPASDGTGIIAGASVRAVAEMAGIKNLLSKSHGSTNPINLVKATLEALSKLRTPETVAKLRGVEL